MRVVECILAGVMIRWPVIRTTHRTSFILGDAESQLMVTYESVCPSLPAVIQLDGPLKKYDR